MGDFKFFSGDKDTSGKVADIKGLLDNESTSKKHEGMKRLIAMISTGTDASSYFPDVVKNVIVPSLEVRCSGGCH